MTVFCQKPGCDRSWPRDPALEVACPVCGACVGARCRRPSGHRAWNGQLHAERDLLADRQGCYGACPSGRCGAPACVVEATDLGLQYVIPGCEKDEDRGPAQLSFL